MIPIVAVVIPPDKKAEVANYLIDKFRITVQARSAQIDGKYQRYLDNYDAKPAQEVRTTPFTNASNFMPQLIRMHTDILTARMIGILFGTRPFWRPTTFLSNVDQSLLNSVAAWMQHTSFNKIQFYPTIDSIVHNAFKTGTVVNKTWMQEDTLFQVAGSDGDGKPIETRVSIDNCKMEVVPFEDFYPYPITAKRLEHVKIKFHRLRMTKESVMYRKNLKVWDEKACDILLAGPSRPASTSQENSLMYSGIALSQDVGQPFNAVEATFDYELSPGKRYALVAVFNPSIMGEGSILRMYYKPGADPFLDSYTDFHLMPRSESFYDDCVSGILEDSQEEQAQVHNARRDANSIANVPGWKKKRYADVANPSTEWYPGKVFEVDNMDDLAPLQFGGSYNSMVEEENFLLQLAERYTGVSPAMQGGGAGVNGKRGSYASQGTMALISEGNRRIDVYLRRMRMPFNKIGRQIFEGHRDAMSTTDVDWSVYGANGEHLKAAFGKDSQLTGGRSFFELSASDAGANRETDRSALMLMANTMSSYYHELVNAAQTIAQAPADSPFQKIMLQVMEGARDLADRLLFAFDINDRDKLLPDLSKLLGPQQPAQGGPQQGPGATLNQGLPQPQGPVSAGAVQDLSTQLAAITSSASQGRPQ